MIFSRLLLYSVIFSTGALVGEGIALKTHEKWWEYKCRDERVLEQFKAWQGDENAVTRILARLHIMNKRYKSVLDIPCGLCVDYEALKRNLPDLEYLGVDITPLFVSKAAQQGIPVLQGRIQEIPCGDSSFEVVYARHILEHLDTYELAIKEMVRVAQKEVMIIFFTKPEERANDQVGIIPVNGYPLYHNRYSKARMETFLRSLPKVKNFSWQEVKNKEECILHILV